MPLGRHQPSWMRSDRGALIGSLWNLHSHLWCTKNLESSVIFQVERNNKTGIIHLKNPLLTCGQSWKNACWRSKTGHLLPSVVPLVWGCSTHYKTWTCFFSFLKQEWNKLKQQNKIDICIYIPDRLCEHLDHHHGDEELVGERSYAPVGSNKFHLQWMNNVKYNHF